MYFDDLVKKCKKVNYIYLRANLYIHLFIKKKLCQN